MILRVQVAYIYVSDLKYPNQSLFSINSGNISFVGDCHAATLKQVKKIATVMYYVLCTNELTVTQLLSLQKKQ